jgi:hypothetical protein
MRAQTVSVGIIAILLAGASYLEFSHREKPLPPSIPVVTTCPELRPGMKRIGKHRIIGTDEHLGFQFDVPINNFTITEGCADAPPNMCGFGIRPKNSTASLSIEWGEMSDMKPPNPILDSLDKKKTERRKVLDDDGKPIGEETWGYWEQGERWRRVHLLGGINARYGSKDEEDVPRYGSVDERDAALFDEIINSACFPTIPSN